MYDFDITSHKFILRATSSYHTHNVLASFYETKTLRGIFKTYLHVLLQSVLNCTRKLIFQYTFLFTFKGTYFR